MLLGDFSAEYLFINIFNFAHSFHSEKETFCTNASNFRHGFSNSAILPCPPVSKNPFESNWTHFDYKTSMCGDLEVHVAFFPISVSFWHTFYLYLY